MSHHNEDHTSVFFGLGVKWLRTATTPFADGNLDI
jgi:hypothetical protein